MKELQEKPPPSPKTNKDFRFWILFLSLCFLAFIVFLDGTLISISLPLITSALHLGPSYVWATNSFWLAGTIIQPLIAQISDIFGRKNPTLISIAIFLIGGAVSGSSRNAATLILGRTVQGVGSGGIMLLIEVILCDVVSLRERSKYLGIVLSMAALGAIVGPPLGGVIAERNWRWNFFLNLPVAGLIFVLMGVSMRPQHKKPVNRRSALVQIDWIGIIIFIGSTGSILLGIVLGSSNFPWRSPNVITPLVIGPIGWVCFYFYESSSYCTNPAVPVHLFRNRTSVAGYAITFIFSTFTTWFAFCWPTYFQAVLGMSPLKAGLGYLVYSGFLIPSAIASGFLVTKTGIYRPIQMAGFLILALGSGLNIMLDSNAKLAVRIILIALNAIGLGCVIPSVLPAILASLPEPDVAKATGMYSFFRSFGYIWGATLPAIIFNSSFSRFSFQISDRKIREMMENGDAYQYVSGAFLGSLPPLVKVEVIDVYSKSLRVAWEVAIAFAVVGMLLVAIEKHVVLRTELDTEYGVDSPSKENEDEHSA